MEVDKMIPERVVIDTSVVLKWIRKEKMEKYVKEAKKLRDYYLKGIVEIIIPDFIFYEFTNVLRYKVDLTEEEIYEGVKSLFDMGFEIKQADPETIKESVYISFKYAIPITEAYYVALAEKEKAFLVTADDHLKEILKDKRNVLHVKELSLI